MAELLGIPASTLANWRYQGLDLRVDLVPYEIIAARVWELRHNLNSYDAWYVAVAERLDAPLATLDRRLAESPGPRCGFVTPG